MDFMDKYPCLAFPEPNTGCWLCVSLNNKYGYARIKTGGRAIGAHRISYEISLGKIPEGMEIDHLCRVTCCVNPDHLEAVSQAENKRRQASGPLCRRGHLRVNLYLRPNGSRSCRQCANNSRRRYIEAKQISANLKDSV